MKEHTKTYNPAVWQAWWYWMSRSSWSLICYLSNPMSVHDGSCLRGTHSYTPNHPTSLILATCLNEMHASRFVSVLSTIPSFSVELKHLIKINVLYGLIPLFIHHFTRYFQKCTFWGGLSTHWGHARSELIINVSPKLEWGCPSGLISQMGWSVHQLSTRT